MNDEELKTYIKLKYFPIQHTHEYLNNLPDTVIKAMYFYCYRAGPDASISKNLKKYFIPDYVAFHQHIDRPVLEHIISLKLFKHYSENMHSIEE